MKAYLRERKNAKCYYCILKWENGGESYKKEVSTGVPIKGNNKREAKQRMEEIREEYEKKYEVAKIILFQNMTFDQFMLQWLENQKPFIKQTTYYGYESIIKNHIIPYFKPYNILLPDLTAQHIQGYYNYKLKQGLSANTVKRHHANIRKALQEALIQDCVPYNVADKTKLPTIIKYQPTIYNSQQLNHLLQVVQATPLEAPVVLCSNYALRRGEVCGLRWIDVDFDNFVIHIRHTRSMAGKEISQDSTKNQSSTRDYPMSQSIYKYLQKLKVRQNDYRLFLGKAYNDSGYVCTWEDGRPLAVSYVSHAFKTLLQKNNLPHIRFHDIRHSVATNLLENDVNLKVIQEYLGHSSITTTANFYLHPNMKHKQKIVDSMSALLIAEH